MSMSYGGLIAALVTFACLYALILPFTGEDTWKSCGIIFNESSSYFGELCVDPSYEVVCEENKAVMYLNYGRHHVDAIIAANSSFHYITTGVDANSCSLINSRSMPYEDVTFFTDADEYRCLTVVRCEKPVNVPGYWDISAHCSHGITTGNTERHYSYALYKVSVADVAESCTIDFKVKMRPSKPMRCSRNCSYPDFHSEYVKGIELRWRPIRCEEWERWDHRCKLDTATNAVHCPEIGTNRNLMSISDIVLYWPGLKHF